MDLYGYFRSSAAYRVRIALNYKGLDYNHHTVHLVKDGGQQFNPEYVQRNPQKLVPTLLDDGNVFTQSMAILEYLEEQHPTPPLLPKDAVSRAHVRALANIIACDVHPLNNLRVLKYLKHQCSQSQEQVDAWYSHWISEGFSAIEALIEKHGSGGQFCLGESPSFADLCLIPQVYNANRFEVDLSAYPLIQSINTHCLSLPYFHQASPEQQPDAG